MIDRTGIGVSDMARSAILYDAALKALGLSRVAQMPPETANAQYGFPDATRVSHTYAQPWQSGAPNSSNLLLGHRADVSP